MDPDATFETSGVVVDGAADAPTGASNFQAASESIGDTNTSAANDVSTAIHTLANNAWTPAGDSFEQFGSNMPVWQCMSSGVTTRSMYTMTVGRQYTFDLSGLSGDPSNGTTVFELSGVVFTQGPGSMTTANLNQPSILQLNGQVAQPSVWTVGGSGACASVVFNATLAASKGTGTTFVLDHPTTESDQVKRSLLVTDAHIVVEWTVETNTASATPGSGSAQSAGVNASSGGIKASTVVPAVLVPLVVLAIAGVSFFAMRRHRARRARLAPSAAFRADHAETIARGVSGNGRASPVPSNVNAWVPLDEKRPFSPYR